MPNFLTSRCNVTFAFSLFDQLWNPHISVYICSKVVIIGECVVSSMQNSSTKELKVNWKPLSLKFNIHDDGYYVSILHLETLFSEQKVFTIQCRSFLLFTISCAMTISGHDDVNMKQYIVKKNYLQAIQKTVLFVWF